MGHTLKNRNELPTLVGVMTCEAAIPSRVVVVHLLSLIIASFLAELAQQKL
jgi:hypothetical protein